MLPCSLNELYYTSEIETFVAYEIYSGPKTIEMPEIQFDPPGCGFTIESYEFVDESGTPISWITSEEPYDKAIITSTDFTLADSSIFVTSVVTADDEGQTQNREYTFELFFILGEVRQATAQN